MTNVTIIVDKRNAIAFVRCRLDMVLLQAEYATFEMKVKDPDDRAYFQGYPLVVQNSEREWAKLALLEGTEHVEIHGLYVKPRYLLEAAHTD